MQENFREIYFMERVKAEVSRIKELTDVEEQYFAIIKFNNDTLDEIDVALENSDKAMLMACLFARNEIIELANQNQLFQKI